MNFIKQIYGFIYPNYTVQAMLKLLQEHKDIDLSKYPSSVIQYVAETVSNIEIKFGATLSDETRLKMMLVILKQYKLDAPVGTQQEVKTVHINIGENQRNSGGGEPGVLQINISQNQRNAGRHYNKAE